MTFSVAGVAVAFGDRRATARPPRDLYSAFWTFPAFRQRVQTYTRRGAEPISTRTFWRFGLKRRLVARIEWLRLCPNAGFFPQL
jgi:hypothetical protein